MNHSSHKIILIQSIQQVSKSFIDEMMLNKANCIEYSIIYY